MLFLGNVLGLTLIFPDSTLNVITTGHLLAQHTQSHKTQQLSVLQTVRLDLTQHSKCDWYVREQCDSRNKKSDDV